MLHPVFTGADCAKMSPIERLLFTDAPDAQIAARRDYERQNRRELVDADTLAAFVRRAARSHTVGAR